MTDRPNYRLQYLFDLAEQDLRDRADSSGREWDPDYNGELHEIADSVVPLYNYDLLQYAAENVNQIALREPEIGSNGTVVGVIQANIYELVMEHLYEVWEKIKEE